MGRVRRPPMTQIRQCLAPRGRHCRPRKRLTFRGRLALRGRLGPLTLLALVPACLAVLLPLAASLHGASLLVVTGGSMAPTIRLGQTLLVQSETAPSPGQVVSYATGSGRVTTHRVVELEQGGSLLRTQGDANASPDPDLTPVAAVFATPDPRFASWGPVVAYVQSRPGRLLLLGPALVLVSLWQVSSLLDASLLAGQSPRVKRVPGRYGHLAGLLTLALVLPLLPAPGVSRSLATLTATAEVGGSTFTTSALFP